MAKGNYKTKNQNFSSLAKKRLKSKMAATSPLLKYSVKDEVKEDPTDPYVKYKQYQKYQGRMEDFIQKELGITLWEKQTEIVHRLQHSNNHQVFAVASHGVGKSYLAAAVILSFTFMYPDSIVLFTAPTQNQVTNILGRLIRSLNVIDSSVHVGDKAPEMHINDSWYVMGKKPGSSDSLQGLHSASGDMLIVVDEAVGVEDFMWDVVEALNNERVWVLAICNPTEIASPAYSKYLSGEYETIHISGLEHPNVLAHLNGEEEPYPGAIAGSHWVKEFLKNSEKLDELENEEVDVEFPPGSGEYYRPNSRAQSRYLGQWPTSVMNSLVSTGAANLFVNNPHFKELDEFWEDTDSYLQVGVDVARMGNDYSVIACRRGNYITHLFRGTGLDTLELAEYVEDSIEEFLEACIAAEPNREFPDKRDVPILIDITGIGAGTYDVLYDHGYNIEDVHFSNRPFDTGKYLNARTELYGNFNDIASDGNLALADDLRDLELLIKQDLINGSIYTFSSNGKYSLIPKKKVAKINGGRSPDLGDAICLAVYPFEGRLTAIELEGM